MYKRKRVGLKFLLMALGAVWMLADVGFGAWVVQENNSAKYMMDGTGFVYELDRFPGLNGSGTIDYFAIGTDQESNQFAWTSVFYYTNGTVVGVTGPGVAVDGVTNQEVNGVWFQSDGTVNNDPDAQAAGLGALLVLAQQTDGTLPVGVMFNGSVAGLNVAAFAALMEGVSDGGFAGKPAEIPVPILAIQPAGSGAGFTLSFSSVSNLTYQIQSSDDLVNGVWSTIATNSGTGGIVTFTDGGATNIPQRFYRVGLPY